MRAENNNPSDCGNKHIDELAARGRMMQVWPKLEAMFPMVAEHAEKVWLARRSGQLRYKMEHDSRFSCIQTVEQLNSTSAWELLAYAALEAAGISPTDTTQLYKHNGIYLEMTDEQLKQLHSDCEWCKQHPDHVPCPITNYPMAHIYVGANGGLQ